jgi:hypothetical protein
MTQFLDFNTTLEILCKSTKKWGVGIFCAQADDTDMQEVLKAAPYLTTQDNGLQIVADGFGYVLCDTEKEMEDIYGQTVGDDGPTGLNKYDGPARVYAITCDPEGQTRNENT